MILEARNIYYNYPSSETDVLEDISITINSGEVVGLVGASGRGKSTLGKILAGQVKPRRGRVLIDGKELPQNVFSPVQLIFQHPEVAVNPKWKLKRTLLEAGAYDEKLLKDMGIKEEFLNRWPNELSGGELQRVCVMRALKPETKFIIADEISTMLDVLTQSQIWEIILDYSKQYNIGILTITHNKHLAGAICSRIVTLE